MQLINQVFDLSKRLPRIISLLQLKDHNLFKMKTMVLLQLNSYNISEKWSLYNYFKF